VSDDWDDDEKTVMAWLDKDPGKPKAKTPPKDKDSDPKEIEPLPMPKGGFSQPVRDKDVKEPTFPPLPGVAQKPRGSGPVVELPSVRPPLMGGKTDDDDKTVMADLDWFDDAPKAAEEPAPAARDGWDDDDKTVFAALPGLPRAETSIQKFIPREAWTPNDVIEQALLGHGLTAALRHTARRAPEGLTPALRDDLIRRAGQRLKHPEDAFLEDGMLDTFRQLVTSQVEQLAMDDLDEEPEMPSGLDEDEQAAWRAMGKGLFFLLRELERRAGTKPRIGRNTRLHDQLVRMGQDPFTGVPTADIARYDPSRRVPMIRAQFMGFFGPFGAFPLNWTEEIQQWFIHGDKSFTRFVDIFTERFQELFFRAWSDAHAITQFDHPTDDRFQSYLLAVAGNGTKAMRDRDEVSDTVKARYAGLAGGRVKSPVRLRQILQLHFDGKLRVEIEELVPTWLDFEPDTLSHMGRQACSIGMNMHLGSRVRTVGEKIRVHLYVRSIKDYFELLPSGGDHPDLRDLVFWYLGEAYEVETVLWLPQTEIQPAVMGVNAQLGWMACIAPPKGDPDVMVQVTVFKLLPPKGQDQKAAA
jgi:type VI secretion system ImpH/TssG family protein